jgi:uncharacterized membrane protein YvlD (DUF360 family)
MIRVIMLTRMRAGWRSKGRRGWQQRFRPSLRRFFTVWLITALGVWLVDWLLPGVDTNRVGAAIAAAAVIGFLNLFVTPIVSAIRLPFTAVSMIVVTLAVNWLILLAAGYVAGFDVDGFGSAALGALLLSVVMNVLLLMASVNDEDSFYYLVVRRLARRSGEQVVTDVPGLICLEIDGLAAPILERAMRAGHAPELARWVEEGSHRLLEWQTDLSSQTGASQAGILLGSNDDIPAFRWVEKEARRLLATSNPDDAAEIERRHSTGRGLLANGGASRANIVSGDADHVLLTSSRASAEVKANPDYRAYFANSFNITRALALFAWEVVLEYVDVLRQWRRNVRPRGERGGIYPFLRAAVCVVVRDLTAYSVIADMFTGRPAVYATFAGYDEVAHHSGIERSDTLRTLRKLDQVLGRIRRAARYAPRPYRIVVLSDHGQSQGATFKQRYGESLDELVQGALGTERVSALAGEDESHDLVGRAIHEVRGKRRRARPGGKPAMVDSEAVVLASGNLGLVYLMREPHRLTREEIQALYPRLIPTLREHPGIGVLLVRSADRGSLAIGSRGVRYLADDCVDGEDPLSVFGPNAARHLRRSDAFPHVADIMVNSFYDPETREGCAFEELIGFHGGLGGEQTRPFILYPVELPPPDGPVVGAEEVHRILKSWRTQLQEARP